MNRAYHATGNETAKLADQRATACGFAVANCLSDTCPLHQSRQEVPVCRPGSPQPVALIREGAELRNEIESKTTRLRQINLRLAELARFKSGQKTAYLVGAGYKVQIRLHENITWDQEKILKFREYLPEEKFAELFKVVYEPTSKKAIDGFVAHADKDLSDGLKWCMSIKPGAPQVIYEKLPQEA